VSRRKSNAIRRAREKLHAHSAPQPAGSWYPAGARRSSANSTGYLPRPASGRPKPAVAGSCRTRDSPTAVRPRPRSTNTAPGQHGRGDVPRVRRRPHHALGRPAVWAEGAWATPSADRPWTRSWAAALIRAGVGVDDADPTATTTPSNSDAVPAPLLPSAPDRAGRRAARRLRRRDGRQGVGGVRQGWPQSRRPGQHGPQRTTAARTALHRPARVRRRSPGRGRTPRLLDLLISLRVDDVVPTREGTGAPAAPVRQRRPPPLPGLPASPHASFLEQTTSYDVCRTIPRALCGYAALVFSGAVNLRARTSAARVDARARSLS